MIKLKLKPLLKAKQEQQKTPVSTKSGALKNIYKAKVNRIIKKKR